MVGTNWGFWCVLFCLFFFNLLLSTWELFTEGKCSLAWNWHVSGSQLVPVHFAPGCGVSLRPKYLYAPTLHWYKACASQMLICRKSQKPPNPCHYKWLKELLNWSSGSPGVLSHWSWDKPWLKEISPGMSLGYIQLSRDLFLSLDALSSQSTFYHYSLAWPLILS